jgi:hypothetical protein
MYHYSCLRFIQNRYDHFFADAFSQPPQESSQQHSSPITLLSVLPMQLADAHSPSLALSKSGTKPMNIGGCTSGRSFTAASPAVSHCFSTPPSFRNLTDVLGAEEVVVAGVPEHQNAVRPAPVRAAVRAQHLEHLVAVHGGQRQPRRWGCCRAGTTRSGCSCAR